MLAAAPASSGPEIGLAQAPATSAQTTSLQNPNTVSASSASDANSNLAEIVVTGSSIKTINGETALPVQILKRDDIARTGARRFVSAYETLDAQASYIGLQNFTFTLGGKNILNKNPPYANYAASANNFIGGYDISYGDPRGSFIYGRVVYAIH